MKKILFRKSLVIGIIVLFVGASLVPSISGNDGEVETIENNNDNYNNLVSQVIKRVDI